MQCIQRGSCRIFEEPGACICLHFDLEDVTCVVKNMITIVEHPQVLEDKPDERASTWHWCWPADICSDVVAQSATMNRFTYDVIMPSSII